MTKTMSIRMDRENFEFLNELTKEQRSDFSKAVRDMVTRGRILYAVERYKNGEASLGRAAELAGVPVGRVDNINLDSQYAAIVRLEVNKEVQLPNDTIASIKTSGLIGDKYVALSPGSSPQNLGPGSLITDTESAVDLESIISRFAFGSV